MEAFEIKSFKFGIDTRRTELTSQPGTLMTGENVVIDAGGVLNKRLAFVAFSNLGILDGNGDTGTFWLQETDSGPMTFGSAVVHGGSTAFSEPILASAIPVTTPQVQYQQLRHPEIVDSVAGYFAINYDATKHKMTQVVASCAINGKAFVAAKFSDGRIYLYYNGSLINASRNGIVSPNVTSLANLGIDLGRQINALSGWSAVVNKSGNSYTGGSNLATTRLTGAGVNGTVTLTVAAGVVTAAVVGSTPGSGYVVGDLISPVDATGSGAILRVATVSGSGIATLSVVSGGFVTTNGVDVVKSPVGANFSPVMVETAANGALGQISVDQNNSGTGAQSASAAFKITTNGTNGVDTATVTAFSDVAGSSAVTLANAVVAGASIAASVAAIVAAINAGSMFHGYTALATTTLATGDTCSVFAPQSFGNVTFNLTVTTTGAFVQAAGTVGGTFALTLTPANPSKTRIGTGTTTVSVSCVASTAGASGAVTFTWAEEVTGSGNGIGPLFSGNTATGANITFYKTLTINNSVDGTFKCTAVDGVGNTVVVHFSVHLENDSNA
jgi:hypothetical protein